MIGELYGDVLDGDEEIFCDVIFVMFDECLGLYWIMFGEWSIVMLLLLWIDGGICIFRGRRFLYFRMVFFMYNFLNKFWLN